MIPIWHANCNGLFGIVPEQNRIRGTKVRTMARMNAGELAASPELSAKIGAITNQLLEDLPDDTDDREQALIERALRYAAEAEQRMSDQMQRIVQLENLSSTDGLTGLLNRRGFENHLALSLARARRYGEIGAIAYLDLDDFKGVNDSYGHAAGDEVLKAVARTLTGAVRQTDIVGRLGGDEFAVVLVSTVWQDAAKRARTIRWRLNATGIVYRGYDIPLQVSIGVEPYGADDGVVDLIHRADMAMYHAKRRRQSGLMHTAAE